MHKFLTISMGLLFALNTVFADTALSAEILPVGHWPLNEGKGVTAKNKISDANDGAIRNAEWIDGHVTMYGQQEKLLSFNGTDSLVGIPLENLAFHDKLTIEVTVKLERKPGEDFSKWKELNHCLVYNTYKGNGFELAVNAWGKISAYVNTSDGLKVVREFGAPIFDEWHTVALTYDGSNIIVYVDGKPRATEAHTGTIKSGERLMIGSRGDNSFTKGCIKDVKIYNAVAIGKTEHSFVPVVIYESSFDDRMESSYKNLQDINRPIYAARGTPEVNGRLDDDCWKDAQKLSGFLLAGSKPPAFALEKTAGYICHDDNNLYIGIECFESSMDKIRMGVTAHDSTVWVDDVVEIFLAGKSVPKKYYHLFVNPIGTKADVEVEFIQKTPLSGVRYKNNFDWNPAWTAVTGKSDKSWTVEMSIPWRELQGINIDNILINLCRAQKPRGEFSTFGYLDTSGFNDPDGFNPVSIKSKDTAAEEKFTGMVKEVRELEEKKKIQLSRIKSFYKFPYAFDFGSAASPSREGFTRITEKSLYNNDAGAGFKKADGLTATIRKNTWGKQEFLGELTCDFVEGTVDNEFIVDVPEGKYLVHFLVGDVYVPPVFSVSINGKEALKATAGSNIYRILTVLATAENGSLSIGFRGKHSWLVNAIVLYPEKDAFQFAVDMERLEEEICLGSNTEFIARFIRYRFEDKTPPPAISSEAERSGYFLFSHNYMDIIYQDSAPKTARIKEPLPAAATPGEYIPVTFSVHPVRNLSNLTVEYTDLISAEKNRIDKIHIQLREVKHYYHNIAGFRPVRYTRFPKILESFSPHYFLKDRNYTFWFTIRVPGNAQPGDYFSTVTIKTSEDKTESFRVKLTVYPFRLDSLEDYSFAMCYHLPKQNRQRGIDGWETLFLELKDMKEHNMNTVAPIFLVQNMWPEFGTGRKSLNIDSLVKFFQYAKQVGLTRPIPLNPEPYLPYRLHGAAQAKPIDFKPEEWSYIRDGLQQLQKKCRQEGLPDFYFYLDEPYMAVVRDNYKAVFEYLHDSGIKNFCTIGPGPHYFPLFPFLDTGCYGYGITGNAEILKEVSSQTKKAGLEFWVYNGPTWTYIPAKSRFNMGYGTWRSGAKGHMIWDYFIAWAGGQPLNPLSNTSGVHAHEILPDSGGPIPTTTWEAIREGIDDLKYIRTLEKLIERNGSSPAGIKAKKFLENLKEEIAKKSGEAVWNDPGTGEPLDGAPLWPHGKYDETRKTIAGYIMEMLP